VSFVVYLSSNGSFAFVAHSDLLDSSHSYILPMAIAVISYVLRFIADFTCSEWSTTCRASSDMLSHIYMAVFFFLIIVASTKAKQISDLLERIKAAIRMLSDSGNSKSKIE
jgi:atlastin